MSLLIGAVGALWLGILTSVSPCPLATNVLAVSFVAQRVGRPRAVLLPALLYTVGRAVTYLALAVGAVAGLLAVPRLASALDRYGNRVLGPILILAGMLLVGLIGLPGKGRGMSPRLQRLAERAGVWGAGLLGIAFALAFCPVSAGLFIGGLIPLAARYGSRVLLPSLYGIGTALPVVVFAVLLAVSARSVAAAFDRVTGVERWARRVTGGLFIVVGIWHCLRYIFEVV